MEIRDIREGRSGVRRRFYMEAKEEHHGTPAKMKELEEYKMNYMMSRMKLEEFEKEMTSARVKLNNIPQGRICNYLLFYDNCNGQKVYKRANRLWK